MGFSDYRLMSPKSPKSSTATSPIPSSSNSSKRPSSLPLNPLSTKSSSMTSMTSQSSANGGAKSPNSSTGKAPPKSPNLRRNSSMKGSNGAKTTSPQAPRLATAARSLVRPCGCGKEGHGHGGHHHDPKPAREIIKGKKKYFF